MLIIFVLNFSVITAKCNTLPSYLNMKKPHLLCYQNNKADPLHIGNESAFVRWYFFENLN